MVIVAVGVFLYPTIIVYYIAVIEQCLLGSCTQFQWVCRRGAFPHTMPSILNTIKMSDNSVLMGRCSETAPDFPG